MIVVHAEAFGEKHRDHAHKKCSEQDECQWLFGPEPFDHIHSDTFLFVEDAYLCSLLMKGKITQILVGRCVKEL